MGLNLQIDISTHYPCWDKGGAQESMGVTLPVTHYIGDMDPEKTISRSQTGTQWSDRSTNPPTKLSTQNLSDLQVI